MKASHSTFTLEACVHDRSFIVCIIKLLYHHLFLQDSVWLQGSEERDSAEKTATRCYSAVGADQYSMNI